MNAFCRIVARGGFDRAAEDLGVSPALLSSEGEEPNRALDCSLPTRPTHTMALTRDAIDASRIVNWLQR